jgi:hypothetical protein
LQYELGIKYTVLLLLPVAIFASDFNLGGSFNIHQVEKCELKYKRACSLAKSTNPTEEIYRQRLCIEDKMKYDKSCKEAYLIRKNIGNRAILVKKYSKDIVVFSVFFSADGQTMLYIVDHSGNVSQLTDNNTLINTNPMYYKLKKVYPQIALTAFVNSDNSPAYSINESHVQLVFKQELRSPPCASCATVALASIAYDFDAQGNFSGIKLLSIESLPANYTR